MIYHDTVLILGAGASKPYGLPLGVELRDYVLQRLTKPDFLRELCEHGFDLRLIERFRVSLSKSGYTSIDSFLSANFTLRDVGKCAIAIALSALESARSKRLWPPNQPVDHWLETLFNLMESVNWAAFKKNKLKIISFNYDRLVEQYFLGACSTRYGVQERTVSEWINGRIIHVHGRLEDRGGTMDERVRSIKRATNGIIILPEAKDDTPEFRIARKAKNAAKLVLFLGFGYHSDNLRRLGFPRDRSLGKPNNQKIFGTNKQISKSEWAQIVVGQRFTMNHSWIPGTTIKGFLKETISLVCKPEESSFLWRI